MTISIFDLFSIGIGPSSSHTVGPMRAAKHFADAVSSKAPTKLTVELFGSLAYTGKGHGTDGAIMAGLEGELPESTDPATIQQRVTRISDNTHIHLAGTSVQFNPEHDLTYNTKETLPLHSNGMRYRAMDGDGNLLLEHIYYSIGGGFIVGEDGEPPAGSVLAETPPPFPFTSCEEMVAHCQNSNLSIPLLMWENEQCWRNEGDIRSALSAIWNVMDESVTNGLNHEGTLPGSLKVTRRAPNLYRQIKKLEESGERLPGAMDWLSVYAIAVNEENAAGGRVVTAPTNGAAGVIPSVLYYHLHHNPKAEPDDVFTFLMVAGAIGILYKYGASISAAEVGCQGEVGVACSMAAGAYAAVNGGTTEQIENAAEIAMEHNLGLTCDPIAGLVQIPCIERNAMGAVKAVNAARMALNEAGTNIVSLDKVIATMMETGRDMMSKYKETSQGGLAVNVPEC